MPCSDFTQLCPKLFQGLVKLHGDYKINLKMSVSLMTRYCVAIPLLPKVKAELEHYRNDKLSLQTGVQEW